ncbi:hypothetical protein EZV62_003735 [Acer yangbiense]|uniref:HMG box domain-containing protein n=1 Tax=Acer yangbiense TaxID=1000413 RepID=A0A5C7IHL7_9ROSI|nr:hypothetical protein EZV62_003735 [Acer yangbiense]
MIIFPFQQRVEEGFVGGEARHQQLHHFYSDFYEMEEKQTWNAKAAEAMEAYKKELEEYNNSIAAATDNKQQPQKELVEEEEEHTTNNIIAGAKDVKPKKNKSKRVKDRSEGGRETPSRGVSREGRELVRSPVSQLKNPDEEGLEATTLEVAYLLACKLPTPPYSDKSTS